MIRLDKALNTWGTPDFAATLKQEIEQLGAAQLPLQQGLSMGNYVIAEPITAIILNATEMEKIIRIKSGIFFKSVIGGCSCADDPAPVSEINEYCEVWLDMDKVTAATTVSLATGRTEDE